MSATDTSEAAPEADASASPTASLRLGIEGMHCASCVARIEQELVRTPGVVDAAVNLSTGYERALQTLGEHREQLDNLASALLAHETLDEPDAYQAAGIPQPTRRDERHLAPRGEPVLTGSHGAGGAPTTDAPPPRGA